MKSYTITVNGKAYAVTMEGGAVSDIAAALAAPVAAPAALTVPVMAPTPVAVPAGTTGSASVSASVPGEVIAVKAAAGQAVEKGDATLVLEATEMEDDIVVPQDGTIASVNASTGDSVESDTVPATLN